MRSLNFNIPLLNNRIVFFDRFKDLGGFLLGMFESLGRTDMIMLYGTSDIDNKYIIYTIRAIILLPSIPYK